MFTTHRRSLLRFWASGFILALAVYFIWRNWADLRASVVVIHGISSSVFTTTIAGVLLTFLLAAMSYRMLVFYRVRFGDLLLVEFAASFINRIVPSGLGGLGAHGLYLRKQKHTIPQATAIVSVNNLLGILMHLLLFAVLLIFVRVAMLVRPHMGVAQWVFVFGSFVLVGLVSFVPVFRRRIALFWRNLLVSLARYRRQPHMLMFAALALMALTLTNLLILYVHANAVGIALGMQQLFVVYSMGVLFGTLVPTPGGLVGVEAGLAAGFVAYGVPSDTAIAAVLAYRLVTYWFPLLPGALCFVIARRRAIL